MVKDFLIDTEIAACLSVPVFLFTLIVLWKVRGKGLYTVFLGVFFEVVLLRLGYALAPRAMMFHRWGSPPVQNGICMGCGMPMVYMMVYHLDQWKKRKQGAKEAMSKR